MPVYEPEVGARLAQNHPEEAHCDLDALMDALERSGVSVSRLGAAIESGRIAVTTYPLLSYADVQRWLNEGMP
jgi:hypothetical protein